MKKVYKAPWDIKLIAITTVIVAILVAIWMGNPGWLPTLITWTIILGCAALGVYGYSIQDGKLLVLRLGWSTKFSLSEIKNIETQPYAMKGSVRVFGIGGLFGYIGKFSNSVLGRYKAYATHGDKTVVIEVGHDQVVVSPDDPDDFVEEVKKASGR